MWATIKTLFLKYEPKIILVVGFVLVSAISFEAGYLKGKSAPESPIIVEKPAQSPKIDPGSLKVMGVADKAGEGKSTPENANLDKSIQNCILVGSKNSTKYHRADCQWAKRIKPENRVCFSSEEEAKSKGYQPDKGCIK